MSVTGKGLVIWISFLLIMMTSFIAAYFLGQLTVGFALIGAVWLTIWIHFFRKILRNHRASGQPGDLA
ncbi:MAG: hypothetical protein ACRC2U_07365 [Aeromonas sp.]